MKDLVNKDAPNTAPNTRNVDRRHFSANRINPTFSNAYKSRKVYALGTQSVLEAAVEKLTKPLGHVVELDERPETSPASSTHLTIEGANLNYLGAPTPSRF